jgi:hypothetical protein
MPAERCSAVSIRFLVAEQQAELEGFGQSDVLELSA